jgi:hypothetical protein
LISANDHAALQAQNIHSPTKLTKWLGVELIDDPSNPEPQPVVSKKKDPKCRFMSVAL